jgi:hypothetical protein
MKIYKVTFNDGGWHSSLPSFTVVAENQKEAIEKVLKENPHYKDWDKWATEFKIDGYVIEVYDEKSYNRDKKISDVL